MIGRLRALAERPIEAHERRRAFALAAAVVLIAAVGLLAVRPADRNGEIRAPAASAPPIATAPNDTPARREPSAGAEGAPPPEGIAAERVERTARRFLDGYLAYLYGHGRAGAIRAATPALARRLARNRPRVSPATRQRRPRVTDLSAQRLDPGRELVVAEIADGGVARYPLELVLVRRGGRWLVDRVEVD
ncbi:MAG: hypothetical protein Q8O56_03885 [Solirubrobacteraceae bacterium]|nr:hypothetical protein [Solirubrobacteraceae bacterium]